MKPAMQLAVVMAYEAFRICLGLPTKHYPISEVIRWMQTVTQTHNMNYPEQNRDKQP